VVSRADFPAADPDEFYWVDLIGCAVVTPDGVDLGSVEAVDDHGAHPLLLVRAQDGRERLIPFVSAHVPEVDLAGRKIVADWDPDF
jgi:16S rRNA processing protein RimM